MHWYMEVLRKYVVFDGRARRREYWMFVLINLLISCALAALGVMMSDSAGAGFNILSALYALAVFLPSLGVSVRRLHDTGRSGWWLLIVLLPLLGVIVFLVLMVLDSEPSMNAYGANPKAAVA